MVIRKRGILKIKKECKKCFETKFGNYYEFSISPFNQPIWVCNKCIKKIKNRQDNYEIKKYLHWDTTI